ncbi:MAG: HD-GYP domain-containing protein, partial [bacterium]
GSWGELAQSTAELLDAALIYGYEQLHDDLHEVFCINQTLLSVERDIRNDLSDESGRLLNEVRSAISQIKMGQDPDFKESIRNYFELLCDFHQTSIELRDEMIEFYRDNTEVLESLFNDFPDPGKMKTENTESKAYYRKIQENLLEQRKNVSPKSEFEPERAYESIVLPAFEESDFEIIRTIALVKQIVENFLFRGVFLKNRFDDLVEEVRQTIVTDQEMYRRLTFPREESDFLLSHIVNVLLLSLFVGQQLDLDAEDYTALATAGLFFDLGMLRVPPAAWMRSEEPSNEEIKKIKKHPLYSTEWMNESYYDFDLKVLSIISRHH